MDMLSNGSVDQLDDWEWEYDHDETEQFHLTLDLTTYDPQALEARDRIVSDASVDALARISTAAGHSTTSTHTPAPAPSSQSTEQQDKHAPSLQILDLHTDNPLVKLGDDLFTCNWMSDLGTQFFVARSGSIPNPMQAGHILDIIGISDIRLLGKPLKLRPNQAWREAMLRSDSNATPTTATDEADNSQSVYTSAGILSVPKHLITDKTTADQASFLERLSAIKVRKNRSAIVRMTDLKRYPTPANASDLRRKAHAEAKTDGRTKPGHKSSVGKPARRSYQIKPGMNGQSAHAQSQHQIAMSAGAATTTDAADESHHDGANIAEARDTSQRVQGNG